MKSRSLDRLMLLLSALDLSREELASFWDDARSISTQSLVRRVSEIRRQQLGQLEFDMSSDVISRKTERRPPVTPRSREKVAARIETLLRDEASLTVDQAAQLLLGAFPEARDSVPPEPGKTGLRRWLLRFLTVVADKDVLQFLETFLGRKRSGVESDWSIG
jgi:hypothetical protein